MTSAYSSTVRLSIGSFSFGTTTRSVHSLFGFGVEKRRIGKRLRYGRMRTERNILHKKNIAWINNKKKKMPEKMSKKRKLEMTMPTICFYDPDVYLFQLSNGTKKKAKVNKTQQKIAIKMLESIRKQPDMRHDHLLENGSLVSEFTLWFCRNMRGFKFTNLRG